jgi:hypothetical protein
VLVEAVAVGLIASVLGIVAGLAVAIGLKRLLIALGIDVPSQGLVVTASTVLVCLVVGVGITVLSALSPARKAAKVPPIAAMQLGIAGSTGYGSKQRIFVGLGVLGLGVAALLVGLFAGVAQPVTVVGAGALLVFFGVSILGRTVSLPLSRAIGAPLPRVRGITGELARENAMRNPKRTAASASALMIGVGLVGFFTIFVSSTKASINDAIDKGFTGDIVLDSGGGVTGGVDPGLAQRVAALPEVAAPSGLRQGLAQIDGTAVIVQAGDPNSIFKIMKIDVRQGSTSDLDASGIGVYKNVAKDKHWTIGSAVPVNFATTGHQTLHVAVIYGENAQAGNYFLGTAAYNANFTSRFDSKVLVKKRDGVSQATALAAVKQAAQAYPGVKVLDRAQYKADQTKFLKPVARPHLRPARPGDPYRAARHREHTGAIDSRAHPRSRPIARGRHDPTTTAFDDPLGGGHHRPARNPTWPRHRHLLRLGARDRAARPGHHRVQSASHESAHRGAARRVRRCPGRGPTQSAGRQTRRAARRGNRVTNRPAARRGGALGPDDSPSFRIDSRVSPGWLVGEMGCFDT